MNNEEVSVLEVDESHYNPLNDVLFKFIFGREERKLENYIRILSQQ